MEEEEENEVVSHIPIIMTTFITLVFFMSKILGYIDWRWLYVVFPLLIYFAIQTIGVILILVFKYFGDKNK